MLSMPYCFYRFLKIHPLGCDFFLNLQLLCFSINSVGIRNTLITKYCRKQSLKALFMITTEVGVGQGRSPGLDWKIGLYSLSVVD